VLDRTVARLLEVVVRSGRVSDVIGRVGRSEFAAVLPATDARGAERLIERLQAAIGSESVGPPARLRAGYVAVQGDADGAADPVDLLLRAAAAMRHSPSLRDVATMPGNPFDAVTSSVLH
jgi:GGDEF domain-containing protein